MKRHGHIKDSVNNLTSMNEKKQAVEEFIDDIGIVMITSYCITNKYVCLLS